MKIEDAIALYRQGVGALTYKGVDIREQPPLDSLAHVLLNEEWDVDATEMSYPEALSRARVNLRASRKAWEPEFYAADTRRVQPTVYVNFDDTIVVASIDKRTLTATDMMATDWYLLLDADIGPCSQEEAWGDDA